MLLSNMVVRMRANKAHRNNRRSHHALEVMRLSSCPHCKTPIAMHNACKNCGMYKGVKVFDAGKKLAKKEKKLKKKENSPR